MKKRINASINAHVRRGAFYAVMLLTVTLLALFQPAAQPIVSHPAAAGLTFAERVAYQRTIEEVYWRHRIWPKENPQPKPSLDAVMSQAQLENKVADYLRRSQALESYWQKPITAEQLQAEINRMATHTKQPDVLRELFEALGNDPFVIAECLARPVLADRLITDAPEKDKAIRGVRSISTATTSRDVAYTLPRISKEGTQCTDNTWTATNTDNAPSGRTDYAAVWTGAEMIVWGGENFSGVLNTGGRYDPGTDSWTITSVSNVPTGRAFHTAIWTGSEMIVWGGRDSSFSDLNTGGRYNPGADNWTATSTANAPAARELHTAVWTGSEMIIWGGTNGPNNNFNSGGRYNPDTDSWIATSTNNVPTERYSHTAVWTGTEMIIWAGYNFSVGFLNSGGRYDPTMDSWTATSLTNAPASRDLHTAVWTDSEMIVWGGTGDVNTGGRYNPMANIWAATSILNAPSGRAAHTAVWTGSEMIVWGGQSQNLPFNTGGRYTPEADNWTATSIANAPEARFNHTAIWTGTEMIVWGGFNRASGALA